MKTKPTQHSVKELREIGIQPDVLLCRSRPPLPDERAPQDRAVHQRAEKAGDLGVGRGHIYKIPMCCTSRASTRSCAASCDLASAAADLSRMGQARRRARASRARGHIAMVGKYVDLQDSYKSLNEALRHAGIHTRTASTSTTSIPRRSRKASGAEGDGRDPRARRLRQARRRRQDRGGAFARENGMPYLGICLGMQVAVIEYARTCCGLEGANSTEFDKQTPHPVIALITEWQDRDGTSSAHEKVRPRRHDAPGRAASASSPARSRTRSTARTSSPSAIAIATRSTTITCRARRRGPGDQREDDGGPAEMIELPQTSVVRRRASSTRNSLSTPRDGHPLFIGFIRAALEQSAQARGSRALKVGGGSEA
jgi:CTP synthase